MSGRGQARLGMWVGLIKGILWIFGKADILPSLHRMIAILFSVPFLFIVSFSLFFYTIHQDFV